MHRPRNRTGTLAPGSARAVRRLRVRLFFPLLLVPCLAQAAGGHHGVDDAGLAEPGQCEVEGWFTRDAGGARLLHAGAACRVGAFELGAASEYARDSGIGATAHALQAKWSRDLPREWAPGVAAGFSIGGTWAAHERPRYQGTTLVGIVTWTVNDALSLHANAGRDFLASQPDVSRGGLAVEWAPLSPRWRIAVERFNAEETRFARAGLRWQASDHWLIDTSYAHRLAGPRASNWTLGATYSFKR